VRLFICRLFPTDLQFHFQCPFDATGAVILFLGTINIVQNWSYGFFQGISTGDIFRRILSNRVKHGRKGVKLTSQNYQKVTVSDSNSIQAKHEKGLKHRWAVYN